MIAPLQEKDGRLELRRGGGRQTGVAGKLSGAMRTHIGSKL